MRPILNKLFGCKIYPYLPQFVTSRCEAQTKSGLWCEGMVFWMSPLDARNKKQKYQNKPLIIISQYIYNALGLICKHGNAHTPETLRP